MGVTLSHGYIKPQNPDTGDTFFKNLESDIQLMNDHVHDGTLGNVLPVVTQTILNSGWIAVAGQSGTYSQVVTLPAQITYDSVQVGFRLSNGTQIFPTVVRINATQYTVFTCDNTQNYTAVYSS